MDYIKVEEQFKNLLSGAVMEYISYFNLNLALPKIKIVIAGGSALNYYFKKEEAEIFETHDFDLRCVYDDYIPPEEDNIISEQLKRQQMMFIDGAIDYLNNFFKKNQRLFKDFTEYVQRTIPSFSFSYENNFFFNDYANDLSDLQGINYIYEMDGKEYYGSLIDIIIESRNMAPEYGYPDKKDNGVPYTLDELIDLYEDEVEVGFVKNYLGFTTEDPTVIYAGNGIYYVSLGYVLWDTVRMLSVTAKKKKGRKYERYIQKYIKIIHSFNNPQKYLRCTSSPIEQFIKYCTNE
jgi:hypothetical protein